LLLQKLHLRRASRNPLLRKKTPVEAAAEKVRSLKASKAPQDEVKAAVEAYIALTEGGSKSESKASVVAVDQTPVEAAAERVRQLKAAKAPQPEVKAAVEAYLALTTPAGAASTQASAPAAVAESKASGDLEAAAEKVKTLKAAKASQAEVKAAVEAYKIEEAKDKVQKLKAAKAPQAEVKAAVEAYIALTEPAASSEPSHEAAAESTPSVVASTPAAVESTPEPVAAESTPAPQDATPAHEPVAAAEPTPEPAAAANAEPTPAAAESADASEDAPAVRMHLGE